MRLAVPEQNTQDFRAIQLPGHFYHLLGVLAHLQLSGIVLDNALHHVLLGIVVLRLRGPDNRREVGNVQQAGLGRYDLLCRVEGSLRTERLADIGFDGGLIDPGTVIADAIAFVGHAQI